MSFNSYTKIKAELLIKQNKHMLRSSRKLEVSQRFSTVGFTTEHKEQLNEGPQKGADNIDIYTYNLLYQ